MKDFAKKNEPKWWIHPLVFQPESGKLAAPDWLLKVRKLAFVWPEIKVRWPPTHPQSITLWLFNIAMENGPFIDGLPIKNGDFPWQTVK